MNQSMCRLCLGNERLKPLFQNPTRHKLFSGSLSLITGLKIELNDGLPQEICTKCKNLVNSALKLRKQSINSEKILKDMGYGSSGDIKLEKDTAKDVKKKNSIKKELDEAYFVDANDMLSVGFDNCSSNFEIGLDDAKEANVKREMSNDDSDSDSFKDDANIDGLLPNIKMENELSKKERRKMYIGLVEGRFDPTKPVKCKICKKCVKWASFKKHCKLHFGLKIVCEFCGKSFISVTHLNRHCRSMHGMKKEHACSECDFMAVDSVQLGVHKMKVHTRERPFICNFCGAAYFSRPCLVQHIAGHSTVKSLKCKVCPRMFKSRFHLARHVYLHHKSKEYTYKCPVCDQIYKSVKYIRVHLKKMHGYTTKDVKIIKIKL